MKDSQKDDLVDLFSDNIRKQKQTKRDDRDEAIEEHKKVSKILENCDKCFDSAKMEKELVLHTGEKVYLAIPWHQGLVEDHLVISPIQHVTCSTQLDEEVWEEMNVGLYLDFRFYDKNNPFSFDVSTEFPKISHACICIAKEGRYFL